MTTITTKQLRQDMPRVIRMLKKGRPITLTYRKKTVGTIQPSAPGAVPLRRGSAEAVLQAIEFLDYEVPDEIRNDPRSMKERLAELRDRDLNK